VAYAVFRKLAARTHTLLLYFVVFYPSLGKQEPNPRVCFRGGIVCGISGSVAQVAGKKKSAKRGTIITF